MAIKVSQVRTAISDKVGTVSGFKEVPFPAEYLGRVQNSVAHKGYGVSITSSIAKEDRQARRNPYYLSSSVRIRFVYRLRPHSVITDYGLSMDAEQDVLLAVLGDYQSTRQGLQLEYNRTTRNFTDSLEYVITELELTAYHHIGV